MQTNTLLPAVFRFLMRLLILIIGVLIVSGLLAWYAGWRTAVELANCFFLVGALVVIAGVYSVSGHWRATRGYKIQQAESVGSEDMHERTARIVRGIDAASSFAFQLFLVGFFLIILSIFLPSIVATLAFTK